MPRPSRCRRICSEPAYNSFMPVGILNGGKIVLTVDEYEVIRLIDLEKLTHEQCSKQMDISRTTVTEIYEAAREKIADAIVNGKMLSIAGGHYRVCNGSAIIHCQKKCKKTNLKIPKTNINEKGADEMRIAVAYENGNVFQHFGHTEQFKIYDVKNGKVVREQLADANDSGHGALAGLLAGINADVLICGGIGGGARMALAEAGIELYGGVNGSADNAVKAFLEGNLNYNPNVLCSHHHGEHSRCGEHKHGCAGSGGDCH